VTFCETDALGIVGATEGLVEVPQPLTKSTVSAIREGEVQCGVPHLLDFRWALWGRRFTEVLDIITS